MPQDNLRSIVYKSFVTCDDPKGVVDCRTFRKSKTNSKKSEEKFEHPKMLKLKKSTLHKEEKKEMVSEGGTEKSLHASSFQLMEVSRGAQKLNQVIDSWSKRTTFDAQSKDVAKDLLIGAPDLQDSLVMLSKLQEASQYMTKLKKKNKEKPCVGTADEVGVERTSSDRLGDPTYQNPRLSADGSSRDCYEELRAVIRNSLARQNLLPPISSKEKAYICRSKMISYAEIPSTSSSSISSMTYSLDFASSESTSSSKIPEEKKPRNSNLIAKLMGLEDFSPKPLQSASQKQLHRDSGLTQKPIFDIDMQKGRMPQVVGQKVDRGCMTLENVIDNMQFKGLLKRNQDQTPPNTSYTERRLTNDASPIVLIKPMHPSVEAEKLFQGKLIQERATLDFEKKQRFWKTKEAITTKLMEYHREDFDSNALRRKSHTGEPPMKKLSPEKEAKTSRKVFAKPRDVEEVNIEKKQSSNKMNASVPVRSLPQNNEIVEKKVDKIQKAKNRKKQVETESVKSKSVSTSLEDKIISTKLRKSETGSNIMNKNCISQQTSTTSNFTIKRTKSALAYRESDQKRSMKNSKPVKELLTANVPSTVCNDDDKLTNLKEKSNTSITDSAPAVLLVTEEETDVAAILIQENCDNRLKTLCKDSVLSIPHVDNNTKCPNEATDYNQHDLKEINFCQTETTADVTISRNQESLHREEPSDKCDAYQPIVLQALTSLHDSGLLNSKFLLDCANEIFESRSQRDKLLTCPLLHVPINGSRVCMSKDKLVEEARNKIENLRSYICYGVNSVPDADIVSSVLERDHLCKGLVAGAWDLGWREGFTRDEIEQIVSDLDKLVINQLIEEVLTDFVV